MIVRVGIPEDYDYAPLIQYSNTTGGWSGFYYDLVFELGKATGLRLQINYLLLKALLINLYCLCILL